MRALQKAVPVAPPVRRSAGPTDGEVGVLVVDDDVERGAGLVAVLAAEGWAARLTRSVASPANLDPDVVVVALQGKVSAPLVAELLRSDPRLAVLVVASDLDAAALGLGAGAHDFVTLPVEATALGLRVRHLVDVMFHQRRQEHERRLVGEERLRGVAAGRGQLVGVGPAMRPVHELVRRVSSSDVAVLVQGESGTGKEQVARAIHEGGRRRHAPLVVVNCSALPPAQLEARFFGEHPRPSEGADADVAPTRGLFLQADQGTLFLDEVGALPPEMQAALVRTLQEKKARPLGGDVDLPFDVRLICGTHRDLEPQLAQGLFRHDLHTMVNVVTITLPALRFRGNDVIELAHHFLARFVERDGRTPLGLSPAVVDRLLAYHWPGNVRELENSLERAAALAQSDRVTLDDLHERIRSHRLEDVVVAEAEADIVSLDVLEERYIRRVLKLLGGNKSKAADLLGLDRRTLHRRLEKYDADRAEKSSSS